MKYPVNELERIIKYAYNHTKYYKRIFDAMQCDPNNDNINEYFMNVPVTTKNDYCKNQLDFISDEFDISSMDIVRTSGSTGKILNVFWDKYDHVKSSLDMWRARREFEINSQSKVCFFHTILKTNVGDGESVITSPKIFMPNDHTLTFSKMQFNDETMSYYYRKMTEFKPKWLLCYPTTLYLFTDYMSRTKLQPPSSIEYIELMGEIVLPNHIEVIKKYFGSHVIVRVLYGMQETNGLAIECSNGHMHILSNNAFIEIEKNGVVNRYAENGKIIVTSLTNMAMPFIRYETGDTGSLQASNECNNVNDIIIISNGRLNELIHRENSSPLESGVLFYIIEYINNIFNNNIKQFRIIQKDFCEFEAIFNLDDKDRISDIEKIFIDKATQYGLIGSWHFEYVDNIAPEASGKLRYFISDMK